MRNTKFPPFVFGLSLFICSISAFAQLPKQSVILMNSKPVLVEISPDGEILRVIRDEPTLGKEYEIKVQEFSSNEKSEAKVEEPSFAVKDEKEIEISSESTQDLKKEDFVLFDPGFATLTPEGILILDKYILKLKDNPNFFAIIRSISTKEYLPLSKNRLNGIKTYMRLRGIDSHRIVTESLEGPLAPEIKIFVTEGKTQKGESLY